VEEIISKPSANSAGSNGSSSRRPKPKAIKDIQGGNEQRIPLPDNEMNRVLGGGLVPGSMVLIGGEPGIGKSTLMLQLALNLNGLKALYITGEESEQQIKMRAQRINLDNSSCYVLTETLTQNIFQQIDQLNPGVIIIDSIQTLHSSYIESAAGSISQIRQCTAELLKYAKESNTPVVIIGHITKDGNIAGPKVLEHMVDTVLQFEGDMHHTYRILRSVKNRFGSTSELGIYEMSSTGLREVTNPSEILISNRDEQMSGIAVSATIEGMRPLLIETQALVSSAAYGTPQRSATGFDLRRLNMLLAVLEKRCGFKLGIKDVFLNIAGGLKVNDPAIDLGVVCAILSSNEDIPINSNLCFAAEVGLSGEIRAVGKIDQRISEADKLGMEQIIVSKYNLKGLDAKKYKCEIKPVSRIEEVFSLLFG